MPLLATSNIENETRYAVWRMTDGDVHLQNNLDLSEEEKNECPQNDRFFPKLH